MKYGVQLYSVRDSVKQNGMRETLRRVSEIGYTSVELAGYGDLDARDLRAALEEFSLKADGAHIGTKALLPENLEDTIADMQIIGIKRLIIPAAKLANAEQIQDFLDLINTALPRLREAGLEVGFHNHDTEFLPNEDDILPMDRLKEDTDLFFELDTYWAFHAGVDPLAEMDRMGNRLKLIHIKDGIPSLGSHSGKPLGLGEAPVEAVYRKAIERGLPIVVESETLTPDGMTEIQICYDYLKSLEA